MQCWKVLQREREVQQGETGSLSGGGSPLVQEKYLEEKACDQIR